MRIASWLCLGSVSIVERISSLSFQQSVCSLPSPELPGVAMNHSASARATGVLCVLMSCALGLSCGGGTNRMPGGGAAKLTKIEVNPDNKSIAKGAALQFSATGIFDDGTQRDLTSSVSWQASPSTVANISAQGDLTGVGKGVAQVSAAYQGVSGSASVTVGSATLVSISVSAHESSLPLGESEPMTATGSFSDGTTQNVTQSVTWSSSGPQVASVNSTGVVEGKGLGTATITATVGSVAGTAKLTVSPAVAVVLNVTPATTSLLLGSSSQFQAIATFSDGTTQDLTATATWTSKQPGVVSVSATGLATTVHVGTAEILAESAGLTGSTAITVTPLMIVSYFNHANAASSGFDGTIRLVDPGFTPGDLCAMVYVFDRTQELNECCGCKISDSGLMTLSLDNDLTANPLTGTPPFAGTIEIVPADPGQNGQCNAGSFSPNGVLHGWETNVQGSSSTFQVSEIASTTDSLSTTQAQVLATECTMIQQLGSSAGRCSCGSSD